MIDNKHLKKIVQSALLSALVAVTTAFLSFPLPPLGYVHMGDCFVLICGMVLGKMYGFFSAGIGSAFADLLCGYAVYMPASFVIKGLCAFTVYALYEILAKMKLRDFFKYIISCAVAVTVVITGYFLYDALVLGYGYVAVTGIIPNMAQGALGIILSLLILHVKKK